MIVVTVWSSRDARGSRFGDRNDRFGSRQDRFGDRQDRFGDRPERGGILETVTVVLVIVANAILDLAVSVIRLKLKSFRVVMANDSSLVRFLVPEPRALISAVFPIVMPLCKLQRFASTRM